jgi:hypothetical protein
MNGWMDVLLASALSVGKMLSSVGRCPVDLTISAPIIGALQMDPNAKHRDFLESGQVIYGDRLPK